MKHKKLDTPKNLDITDSTAEKNNVDLIAIIKITLVIYLLSRVAIWFEYSAINNLIHNNNDFIGNFWRWDSGWYQSIVEHGYATSFNGEAVNWPFFPLWPILLKIISLNGTLPIPLMGLIANQIIFFGALIVFYLYLIEIKTNHESALFAVIMLAISPANIYFCSGLTENSFLLLSLLSFYFLYRKQYIFCIVCAGLLSATRMVGAFFIIPLIYQLYFKDKVQPAKIIPYAIASLGGLILFVTYMQIHTGHPFGFLEIQSQIKDWARPGLVWDDQLFSQIYSVMTNTSHIYDRGIFIFSLVIITGSLIYFKFYNEAIFNLCCILPGLISGNMWNAFRFDTAIFTFYLGLILLSRLFKNNSLLASIFTIILLTIMSVICWFYWLSNSYYFA